MPEIKKVLAALALLAALCQFVPRNDQTALAQGNEPPIPPAPTNGNVVLDTLDWLTPNQEAEINAINKKLDKEGIAQIAVVTFDDCGADKKKFRGDLFNTWGIGHANDNDGLLILVCWYGGDKARRSVEQEVGYGLESTLPGTLTDRVAKEYFVTAFREDQAGNGLVKMVKAYDRLLRKLPAQPGASNSDSASPLAQPGMLAFLGGLGFIILSVIGLLVRKIYVMETTHLSRRGEQQEEREKRKIVLIIAILAVCGAMVFLAVLLNFAIALICGFISTSAIAIGYSWSYRGRTGKANASGEDTSWFASGHSASGSGHGSDGGGGFGGGSSGGSGSSTGF